MYGCRSETWTMKLYGRKRNRLGFRSILAKTTVLCLVTAFPAVCLAWIFGGSTVMLGVAAGFAIAIANFYASLITVLSVSGERPASSIMLVLFSFPTRFLAIGSVLYLISRTDKINTFTTAVTLVVIYTMFAFSEFRFASLSGKPQSKT